MPSFSATELRNLDWGGPLRRPPPTPVSRSSIAARFINKAVLNRTYMGDRFDVGDSEDLRSDGSAAACEKRRVLLRSYEKRGERPF